MRFEKDWGRLGLRYKNLSDFSIGKGTYGISASAVGKDDNLPTYLRITDINDDGTINFASLKSVDRSDADKYRLQPNDIVFARTGGSTGRSYFYDGKDGEFVFAGFLIKFSIDPQKCIPKFIKYYCQSREYYNWVASFNTGSTRGNINAKTFEKMPIPDLPLEQQQLIVDILSPIDDKIENNKKINHHLVAISKNYLKIFYSSNSIKLGDIFELKSGYAFKSKDWVDEGKPVIKIKDIDGITIDITNLNYVKNKSQLSKASNFEVFGKEIVMALTGATTGKIGVIPKNFNGYVNQRVGLFYAKTELSYAVLWSILQQQNIITDLIKLSSGSAQANLSPFSVNSYDLNVTFKDLIELDKVLSPLYELFCFNLSEIQRLSKLRDTLLPKLLSGELSVNQAIK
ncbi:restriction endonuclease subunit S [Streptococcus sanguinis]